MLTAKEYGRVTMRKLMVRTRFMSVLLGKPMPPCIYQEDDVCLLKKGCDIEPTNCEGDGEPCQAFWRARKQESE